ncbi:MAG: VWA domain-containing protein [Zetaproteobacteria bacterium]|nr:VWA domain-containing protein [Zetaproteobacteria bacterium]
MILFDLSTSMLATDQQPSRLEVAQREVIELLKSLEGDRIGIIGFAGSAFVQCPMTSDYEMIRLFLSQLDPHQVSWQGTAIADAILLGQKHLLREQQKARNDKMMILITDGEDQQGEAAQAALQAQRAGIPVHILGVGTEQGSPIPGKDGKFKKNHQGELILSRLNRTHLQELAQTTHGIFEQLRPGAGALTQLYKVAINQLTQNDIEDSPFERSHRIWYERFRPLVIAALLLLIFESLLQRFKRYEA